MESNRRTFPRVPFSEAALLEFTPSAKPGSPPAHGRLPERITVLISSASCEGMRLSRPTAIDNLVPGTRIEVVLLVDNQEVRLPGQCKWTVSDKSGATNVGIALWLEMANATSRHAWATKIVRETQRTDEAQQRQSSQHNAVRVSRRTIKRAATSS